MTVLFLALTGVRAAAVARQCDFLLGCGVGATVVTAEPAGWAGPEVDLDDRIELVSLADGESRLLLRRVTAAPVRRGALGGGTPGRVVGAVHRRLVEPGYRVLRPYLLWRVARRALRDLDVPSFTEVVVVDAQAVPLGWRLARRHRRLPVTLSLDRDRYQPRAGDAAPESASV